MLLLLAPMRACMLSDNKELESELTQQTQALVELQEHIHMCKVRQQQEWLPRRRLSAPQRGRGGGQAGQAADSG